MGIGKMRQLIILNTVGTIPTGTGGATDGTSPLKTIRGRMRRKSGSRELSFGDIVSAEQWELKVRYSDEISGLLAPNMRITYNGKLYTMNGWTLVEEKQAYYLIDLTLDRK